MLKYSSTKVLKMRQGGPYTMPAPFPGSSPTRVLLYTLGLGFNKPEIRYIGKPFSRLRDILFRSENYFRYIFVAFDREHIIFSTTTGKVGPLFKMYYPSISQLFDNGYSHSRFGRYLAALPCARVAGLSFPFFLEPAEIDKPHIDHYSVMLKGRVAEIEGHIKARKELDAERKKLRAMEKQQKLAAQLWKPLGGVD